MIIYVVHDPQGIGTALDPLGIGAISVQIDCQSHISHSNSSVWAVLCKLSVAINAPGKEAYHFQPDLFVKLLRDLSIVQNTPNLEETNSEQQTAIRSSNVLNTTDEPTEIQRYSGSIARNANMLPINYESWHQMPDSNKNQALDNIKERFALEVSDTYVKKALGKKWRDHKSTLKKEYFKKNISLEEKLRNVPPGMLRYQWEDAV
ncbi:hypothetical protein J1N35_033778 [Gossypium stocksii]|uniref:Uncharacterized protein n=1 Tax=Gossypium stocksii TaxID=47602 RepID=A0A9D3UQQ6_9ROSI|nr:hypothetical protein J1N35_033778 [Gossypium stocksii]